MVRHIKYRIINFARDWGLLFWILVFPIVLGTLFKVSFGGYMENEEKFESIAIAYVEMENGDKNFSTVLEELSKEEGMLQLKRTDKSEAEKLLEEEKIKGIYRNDGEITLTIKEEGVYETILKTILDQYEQKKGIIEEIATENPTKLQYVVKDLADSGDYIKQKSMSNGNMDAMMNYFYALIAMACMYGVFVGGENVKHLKANVSPLAARRTISGTTKFKLIFSDFIASFFVQSVVLILALLYLVCVLKVDFGSQLGLVFLTTIVGGLIGISQGMLVYAITGKFNENIRQGVAISISMLESFLSGLMVGNMKNVVEQKMPILNDLNPAALISDALYSLNVYSDYKRFTQNIVTMLVMAVVFWIISYLLVRREKYASI